MPRFHGTDYYFLAIAQHTAGLNKAILNIPHSLQRHVSNCCINLMDILEPYSGKVKTFTDIFEVDLEDLTKAVELFQDLKDETIEPYTNDNIVGYSGDWLFEVIPSSNPESSCSLDASLQECSLKCRDATCTEKFYTEEIQPFDEPVSVNHFQLAIEAIPSASALLSRLNSVDLADPLLKLDGSEWKEEDFICFDHGRYENTTEDLDVHSVLVLKKETFNKLCMEETGNICSELLLPFSVPGIQLETCPRQVYSIDSVDAVINTGDYNGKDLNLLEGDFELDKSKLTSGLSQVDMVYGLDKDFPAVLNTSATPFYTLNNIGVSPHSQVQSGGGFQKNLSPFVEYRIVEILKDEEALPKSLLEDPLEALTAEEGLFSNGAMFTEDFKHLEKHIWEQEKHFDEIQLPEPVFIPETLPDPVKEVVASIKLEPEETEVENEGLQWSFDQPDDNICSQCSIITIDDDICISQPDYHESFDKFETSEMDFIFISGHDYNEDIFVNEVTQDNTAVEIVDLNTADMSTQENVQFPLDPLDSFIHVRARSDHHPSTGLQNCREKHGTSVCTVDIEQSVITSIENIPQSSKEQCTNIKTLQVVFSGQWEKVLQCIIDSAALHLDTVKKETLIPPQQGLMDISIDMTRFLIKEREKQVADVISQATDSFVGRNVLQSLTVVHLLRTAADLLLNACLESCISYLAAQVEGRNSLLGKSCDEVHKHLFQYQCHFLQENITHPKLSIMCHEVGIFSKHHPGCKILVLVQKGLNSLVSAIENMLCSIPHLTVMVMKDGSCMDIERTVRTTVFVAHIMETWTDSITQFSLVILYDEKLAPHVKTSCQNKGVPYIGILTQHMCDVDNGERPDVRDRMPSVSLLCSTEVTCHKELVCLLETRYNILVIEREYHKLCGPNVKIYFADLIVSATHCIVLLSLEDMKKHWDLTAAVTRLVALGLQFSHCCIILHDMNAATSYAIERETLSNLYKMTAALSNLRGASPAFDASYKVLVSLREDDVALSIRNIVGSFLTCNQEPDLLRPWLSADASQDEVMLLQMNCLNSFSAQMLLQKLTISEILRKSYRELTTLCPDIPEKIIKYMNYTVSSWKHQQSCLTNDSQVSHGSDLSSSSYKAVVTQTSSPHSHTGSSISISQTQTAVSDYDFGVNLCQPAIKLLNSPHPLMVEDTQKFHSHFSSNLAADPIKSVRLTEAEKYNFSMVSRPAEKMHENIILKAQDWSNPRHNTAANSLSQSCEASDTANTCPGCMEVSPQSQYDKLMLSVHQNKLAYSCDSRYTDSTQVNADLDTLYRDPHILGGVENRLTSTHVGSNTAYHSNSLLKSSAQHEVNYQSNPLGRNCVSEDSHAYTHDKGQLQPSPHNCGSSVISGFRNTSDEEESLKYFYPNIVRAVQAHNAEAWDENAGSSFKKTRYPNSYSESLRNNSPHITHGNKGSIMIELHKGGLSPSINHSNTLWNMDEDGGYASKEDVPFLLSVSNKHKGHKLLHQDGLTSSHEPVKREIEDVFNDNRFSFIGNCKSNLPEKALQKPLCNFTNDRRLHKLDTETCEESLADIQQYSSDNSKFVDCTDSSSFILKHLTDRECNSTVSDLDMQDRGQGFGIYSSKARRDLNISGNCYELSGIRINEAAENDRSRSFLYDPSTITSRKFSSGLLPVSDKIKPSFDCLPFSVSKDLRKHIIKLDSNSREFYNPGRSFLEGNQSSVRVSRQPEFVNRNANIPLLESSDQLFVHDQMKNDQVRQLRIQHQTRGKESTTLGDVNQAVTRYCHTSNCSCVLKHRDCIQPSYRNQFDTNQVIPLNKTYFNQPPKSPPPHSLSSSHHLDRCRTNSSPEFIKNVTLLKQHQKYPSRSYDGMLPETGGVQLMRQSGIPYTPRHRVTVGLAQPFPRQSSTIGPRDVRSSGSQSQESERQQPVRSHLCNNSVISASPPMDLEAEEACDKTRGDEKAAEYDRCIYEAKRQKWEQHLLSYTSQDELNHPRPGTSNFNACSSVDHPDVTHLSSLRKRKLQFEQRPSNEGQTVLVFK